MLALFSIFSFFFFFFLDTDTHYLIIVLEFNDVHLVYSLLGRLQPDKLKFELPASQFYTVSSMWCLTISQIGRTSDVLTNHAWSRKSCFQSTCTLRPCPLRLSYCLDLVVYHKKEVKQKQSIKLLCYLSGPILTVYCACDNCMQQQSSPVLFPNILSLLPFFNLFFALFCPFFEKSHARPYSLECLGPEIYNRCRPSQLYRFFCLFVLQITECETNKQNNTALPSKDCLKIIARLHWRTLPSYQYKAYHQNEAMRSQ